MTSLTTDSRPTAAPELAPRPSPPADSAPPGLPGLALAVVLAGAFLSITDFFIVNVAIGDIGRRLDASTDVLELVVTGYGVTYALLLVLGGRLGDTFGRRRLFLVGLGAFTVTSLACGVAPTAGVLVAARVLQGASAAVMVPQVLGTLQATTAGRRRARALAWFGATGGMAAATGQLLGGFLVSADVAGWGWRTIFLVNVPVGLLALLLAPAVVPESRAVRPARADVAGTLLMGAAVLLLLVPLTEGRALGWPAWSWAMLAVLPLVVAVLVRVEIRLERAGRVPLLPPSLVRVPSMRRGLVLALPFFAGFGGFMFVYAVAVQQVVGWTPFEAGLGLLPMAVAFLAASLSTSWLLSRFGRDVLTVGLVIQCLGYVVLALTARHLWATGLRPTDLWPGLVMAGLGQGLVMSPLFGVVLSGVPEASAGVGAGVLTTTQQTALALGTTGLGSLFVALASPHALGGRDAFVLVLLVQVGVAAVGSLLSRTLPDHGRRPG